jgi:hypothetical protein
MWTVGLWYDRGKIPRFSGAGKGRDSRVLICLISLISLKRRVGTRFYHVFQGMERATWLDRDVGYPIIVPDECRFPGWMGEYGPKVYPEMRGRWQDDKAWSESR